MAAPGALSHDRDARPIHSQLARIGVEPLERGVVLLDRPGISGFRRQRIVDGDDHAVELARHLLLARNLRYRVSEDEAAAVRVQDRRAVLPAGVDDVDGHGRHFG